LSSGKREGRRSLPFLGGIVGNPVFEITLRLEMAKEPFGKKVEAITRADMAMELSRIITGRQKDIKKVFIINFTKLEAGSGILQAEAKSLREMMLEEKKNGI
jgi:hypothetical protein